MVMIVEETDVLLVIDLQNDFLPGGSLPVDEGDQVIPVINTLTKNFFRHVVATQDWHPANHLSFASQHKGKAAFESIQMPYGAQVLWPDHCVQGTVGAALCNELDLNPVQCIIRKGSRRGVDSYSAFRENDRQTVTGLDGYLRARGVRRVFVAGLARGYCTDFSAADAMEAGYETVLVKDACRGISVEATKVQTKRLQEQGVRFVSTNELRLA